MIVLLYHQQKYKTLDEYKKPSIKAHLFFICQIGRLKIFITSFHPSLNRDFLTLNLLLLICYETNNSEFTILSDH